MDDLTWPGRVGSFRHNVVQGTVHFATGQSAVAVLRTAQDGLWRVEFRGSPFVLTRDELLELAGLVHQIALTLPVAKKVA